MAGGASGVMAWTIVYPIDVLKTRYARNYPTRDSATLHDNASLQPVDGRRSKGPRHTQMSTSLAGPGGGRRAQGCSRGGNNNNRVLNALV
jgi:hypothetical protein